MYYTDSNITFMYDLISNILDAKYGEKSLLDYYSSLVAMFEELTMHQYLTPNVEQQRKQREEFHVVKFLAIFRPKYDGV